MLTVVARHQARGEDTTPAEATSECAAVPTSSQPQEQEAEQISNQPADSPRAAAIELSHGERSRTPENNHYDEDGNIRKNKEIEEELLVEFFDNHEKAKPIDGSQMIAAGFGYMTNATYERFRKKCESRALTSDELKKLWGIIRKFVRDTADKDKEEAVKVLKKVLGTAMGAIAGWALKSMTAVIHEKSRPGKIAEPILNEFLFSKENIRNVGESIMPMTVQTLYATADTIAELKLLEAQNAEQGIDSEDTETQRLIDAAAVIVSKNLLAQKIRKKIEERPACLTRIQTVLNKVVYTAEIDPRIAFHRNSSIPLPSFYTDLLVKIQIHGLQCLAYDTKIDLNWWMAYLHTLAKDWKKNDSDTEMSPIIDEKLECAAKPTSNTAETPKQDISANLEDFDVPGTAKGRTIQSEWLTHENLKGIVDVRSEVALDPRQKLVDNMTPEQRKYLRELLRQMKRDRELEKTEVEVREPYSNELYNKVNQADKSSEKLKHIAKNSSCPATVLSYMLSCTTSTAIKWFAREYEGDLSIIQVLESQWEKLQKIKSMSSKFNEEFVDNFAGFVDLEDQSAKIRITEDLEVEPHRNSLGKEIFDNLTEMCDEAIKAVDSPSPAKHKSTDLRAVFKTSGKGQVSSDEVLYALGQIETIGLRIEKETLGDTQEEQNTSKRTAEVVADQPKKRKVSRPAASEEMSFKQMSEDFTFLTDGERELLARADEYLESDKADVEMSQEEAHKSVDDEISLLQAIGFSHAEAETFAEEDAKARRELDKSKSGTQQSSSSRIAEPGGAASSSAQAVPAQQKVTSQPTEKDTHECAAEPTSSFDTFEQSFAHFQSADRLKDPRKEKEPVPLPWLQNASEKQTPAEKATKPTAKSAGKPPSDPDEPTRRLKEMLAKIPEKDFSNKDFNEIVSLHTQVSKSQAAQAAKKDPPECTALPASTQDQEINSQYKYRVNVKVTEHSRIKEPEKPSVQQLPKPTARPIGAQIDKDADAAIIDEWASKHAQSSSQSYAHGIQYSKYGWADAGSISYFAHNVADRDEVQWTIDDMVKAIPWDKYGLKAANEHHKWTKTGGERRHMAIRTNKSPFAPVADVYLSENKDGTERWIINGKAGWKNVHANHINSIKMLIVAFKADLIKQCTIQAEQRLYAAKKFDYRKEKQVAGGKANNRVSGSADLTNHYWPPQLDKDIPTRIPGWKQWPPKERMKVHDRATIQMETFAKNLQTGANYSTTREMTVEVCWDNCLDGTFVALLSAAEGFDQSVPLDKVHVTHNPAWYWWKWPTPMIEIKEVIEWMITEGSNFIGELLYRGATVSFVINRDKTSNQIYETLEASARKQAQGAKAEFYTGISAGGWGVSLMLACRSFENNKFPDKSWTIGAAVEDMDREQTKGKQWVEKWVKREGPKPKVKAYFAREEPALKEWQKAGFDPEKYPNLQLKLLPDKDNHLGKMTPDMRDEILKEIDEIANPGRKVETARDFWQAKDSRDDDKDKDRDRDGNRDRGEWWKKGQQQRQQRQQPQGRSDRQNQQRYGRYGGYGSGWLKSFATFSIIPTLVKCVVGTSTHNHMSARQSPPQAAEHTTDMSARHCPPQAANTKPEESQSRPVINSLALQKGGTIDACNDIKAQHFIEKHKTCDVFGTQPVIVRHQHSYDLPWHPNPKHSKILCRITAKDRKVSKILKRNETIALLTRDDDKHIFSIIAQSELGGDPNGAKLRIPRRETQASVWSAEARSWGIDLGEDVVRYYYKHGAEPYFDTQFGLLTKQETGGEVAHYKVHFSRPYYSATSLNTNWMCVTVPRSAKRVFPEWEEKRGKRIDDSAAESSPNECAAVPASQTDTVTFREHTKLPEGFTKLKILSAEEYKQELGGVATYLINNIQVCSDVWRQLLHITRADSIHQIG